MHLKGQWHPCSAEPDSFPAECVNTNALSHAYPLPSLHTQQGLHSHRGLDRDVLGTKVFPKGC